MIALYQIAFGNRGRIHSGNCRVFLGGRLGTTTRHSGAGQGRRVSTSLKTTRLHRSRDGYGPGATELMYLLARPMTASAAITDPDTMTGQKLDMVLPVADIPVIRFLLSAIRSR